MRTNPTFQRYVRCRPPSALNPTTLHFPAPSIPYETFPVVDAILKGLILSSYVPNSERRSRQLEHPYESNGR
jgi:hypothetical protein